MEKRINEFIPKHANPKIVKIMNLLDQLDFHRTAITDNNNLFSFSAEIRTGENGRSGTELFQITLRQHTIFLKT